MKNILAPAAVLAALLGPFAGPPAFASDRYPEHQSTRFTDRPEPESEAERLHEEKYRLGQKVYAGKTVAPDASDAEAQRPRLQAAQAALPAKTAKKKDLVALAGKLSVAQLDALEYFVKHRYPAKRKK